jgi:hypothetical protein
MPGMVKEIWYKSPNYGVKTNMNTDDVDNLISCIILLSPYQALW